MTPVSSTISFSLRDILARSDDVRRVRAHRADAFTSSGFWPITRDAIDQNSARRHSLRRGDSATLLSDCAKIEQSAELPPVPWGFEARINPEIYVQALHAAATCRDISGAF